MSWTLHTRLEKHAAACGDGGRRIVTVENLQREQVRQSATELIEKGSLRSLLDHYKLSGRQVDLKEMRREYLKISCDITSVEKYSMPIGFKK